MKSIITSIAPGSIAEEVGIEKNDALISINGKKVNDIIDYKFLSDDEELVIEIEKADSGEIWEIEIEKDYGEELGIEFGGGLIDKAERCSNKCIFCFIDQLPKGMRESLYFKDDDSRLSFLQGNFVTLTNMSEDDINNIIRYRISPINISVHTTNPELRRKMINNKFAGKLMDTMRRLADAGIEMNAQIVLCPGYNDKEELERTLEDLASLRPYVHSAAIVPVGITRYRDNLAKLDIFDEKSAGETIDQVHKLQEKYLKELNTRFAFLSDEFYIIAKRPLLKYDEYEGFIQFEDGVGMITKMGTEIINYLDSINDERLNKSKKVSIATGKSAYEFMCNVAEKIMDKFKNIEINVYRIKNNFFGETITVSGLLTATDLIDQLKDKDLGETLYITRSMMKADEEIFLDNITLKELEEKLNIEVVPCQNEGIDFVDKVTK